MSVEALSPVRETVDVPTSLLDDWAHPESLPAPRPMARVESFTATDDALALIALIVDTADADAAALLLVQHLRSRFAADRVGLMPPRGLQAEAVAPPSPATRDASECDWHLLRDEAALTRKLVRTMAAPGADSALRFHHARHAEQHGVAGVMTVPLRHGGSAVAYCVLERRASAFTAAEAERLQAAAIVVGPWLGIARRAERPLLAQAADRLRQRFTRQQRAVQVLTAATLLAAAALIGIVASWPIEAHVSAPAHVEGVEQRQLVAPVDGYLVRVLARPGDEVHAGQVLAEFDDREMKLEADRLDSDVAQETSQADEALARHDRAGAVIHQARADASQAQLDLVRLHLRQTALQAPFDGIVVEGDLRNRTGSPVRQGDLLMALAPAGRYRVLADVAERDAASVLPGAAARLVLAADPDRPLALTVRRVSPVGREVDGAVSFEIEAEAAAHAATASDPRLRPGLSGSMRISIGQRPLWRQWAGRLVDAVKYQAWALGL